MSAEEDSEDVKSLEDRPASSNAELDYESDDSGETENSDREEVASHLTVGSAKPVKGEAFCDCYKTGREKECVCGEDDSYFEWTWDSGSKSAASFLKHDQREVVFHVDYSCGTAAVRGSQPMCDDQYYWEVKMTTPVYGTDMMVGVGTVDLDLNKYRHKFCSLVGRDAESWGMSYTGMLHHKGLKQMYASKFGQGTIIGVHLDMWHGTLSFYKNRKPLGIAYRGLQGKKLYPVVSSTAARSGMKVIKCRSFKTSLQFMCCQVLRTVIPRHLDVLKVIDMPPGLREFLENNMSWLLQPNPIESPTPSYSEMFMRGQGVKRKFSSSDDDCDGSSTSSKNAR
ncbi:SPRY domain-containing SOCS box protein 3-like isoform X2 [Mya arenaria]|uniref:SPRY domain-containing SOCS box protein 3-like isoform X2 n=1 Tax=Mya arenaria TaxID=6604 RepID=UPI0022E78676|nr:SPRY domain-containing SOCS box protein 3-like isoform X2 [Mya arenaria]XP_052781379.1 SPRY domain-containing SOCS box protein 3-like isoform X2 [Mya arenaria]